MVLPGVNSLWRRDQEACRWGSFKVQERVSATGLMLEPSELDSSAPLARQLMPPNILPRAADVRSLVSGGFSKAWLHKQSSTDLQRQR